MTEPYVPEKGDFISLVLNPLTGREQGAERPALVVSTTAFNRVTRYALIAPITSRTRGWPFEVVIRPGHRVAGAVLCDQTRSVDFAARHASFLGKAPSGVLSDVLDRIRAILDG